MQYTSTPHTPNQDSKLYFPHSALLETKRPPKNLSAVVSVKQSPNSSFLDYNQSTTPTDNSFYLPQSFGNFVPISINSRHMGLIKPKPKKKKTALDPIRFFYPVKLKEKEPIQKPKPLKLISHDSMRQPVTSDIRSIAPIKQRIESIIENQNVCVNMRKRLPGIEPQNYTFDFSKQTPRKMGMEEYLEKINENPLPKPKQSRNKNVSFDQYSQQYSQLGSSDSQRSALNLDSSRLDAVLPPIRNNSPIKPAVQLPTIRLKNPPQIIRKRRDYSVDDRSDLGTVREEVEVKQRPQQSFIEKRIFTFENAEEQLSSRESHATKAKRFLKEGKELEVSIHKDIDEYREKLLQKLKRERISRNPSSPSQRWGD